MCSLGKPSTQGQAGGNTFPSVQWSGCVRLVSYWVREVNLLPTLTVPGGGRYDWGGLPKARIIKFMNFNGGICSPYSFLPPGGVRNYIERSSMATDLNFSGCHNIN